MAEHRIERRGFLRGGSALLGGGLIAATTRGEAAVPTPGPNPTQRENARPPGFANPGDWAIQGNRSQVLSAFAGPESIERGTPLTLRIAAFDPNHDGTTPDVQRVDIYRLGWYGGFGARLVSSTARNRTYRNGFVLPPPPAATVVASGLPFGPDILDYSTWFAITFATTGWATGMYVAKLTDRYGGQIYAYFVVRPTLATIGHYRLLVTLPFNTYQAYNAYDGAGLYGFNTGNNRACGVSHNRPLDQAMRNPGEYNNMLRSEYAMALWLEREGYAVAYLSDTDFETQQYAAPPAQPLLSAFNAMRQPRALVVGGHSEYWTGNAYDAFMTARDTYNTHLMFLAGNSVYWRVHFEGRTMYCFKESWRLDTSGRPPTNLWRSYPNNRPENQLLGGMYVADDDVFQGNPSTLASGASDGAIGWEWDTLVANSTNPIPLDQVPPSSGTSGEGIGPNGAYDRYDSQAGSAPNTIYDVGQHHLFANQFPLDAEERTSAPPGAAFPLLLGLRFRVTKPGQLVQAWYWRSPNETAAGYLSLWNADTGALITASRANAAGPNRSWWTAVFSGGLRLEAGVTYTIAVIVNSAYYARPGLLSAPGESLFPIETLAATDPNETPVRALPGNAGANQGIESDNVIQVLEGATGCVYGTYTSDDQPAPSLVEDTPAFYFIDLGFVPDGTVPNDSLATSTAIGWPSANGRARTFAAGSIYWAFALSPTPAGDLADGRGANGDGIRAAVTRQLRTRMRINPGP